MYTLTNLQPKFKIFYSFYYRKFSERISGYASLCLRIHEEKPRNLKFLGFYERRRPDLNLFNKKKHKSSIYADCTNFPLFMRVLALIVQSLLKCQNHNVTSKIKAMQHDLQHER